MKRLLALTMMGLLVLPATQSYAVTDPRPRANIGDTLKTAGTFETLWKAAEVTGILDELNDPGMGIIVLAPTDEAFAKLPAGTVERLMQPEHHAELARVLKNHVLPGRVLAASFEKSDMKLPTMLGENVSIGGGETGRTVNGARITSPDIVTSSGVIHIIDGVLLPQS